MIRRLSAAALAVAIAIALTPDAHAAGAERHHYRITARVRPLVVFWITRDGVGDAVVTRSRGVGETRYSLLIGSDPERAPFHINRWGYIEEEIRGREARLTGLMTQSDEESIAQAEANIRSQASGRHPFKVIETTADGERATSRVRVITAPEDYTIRQLPSVLDLAQRERAEGTSRVVHLPEGARPGFLAAIADSMRDGSPNPITYAYYGRLYELRRTRARRIPNFQSGAAAYGPAVAAEYVSTSAHDGEQTRFSITYGTEGAFAEVPLRVTYQPRWWMQVELNIDDAADVVAAADGVRR